MKPKLSSYPSMVSLNLYESSADDERPTVICCCGGKAIKEDFRQLKNCGKCFSCQASPVVSEATFSDAVNLLNSELTIVTDDSATAFVMLGSWKRLLK